MDEIRAMFLRQSMQDCEEAFAHAIARKDVLAWDWLVVTAANESQAAAYQAQIDRRLAAGLLPRQTRYVVYADPGGKRVGSGGATLNVLREIARADGSEGPFDGKRILVLHSGGDSQRIPQYSACGKLFARVPRQLPDGRPSTLFDEFCIALSSVPARMQGGMLIMSGDVLLLFNALQIDLERLGAACLSIKAPVETGTHHGVFLSNGDGQVQEFLHKQPESVLRACGAVNAQDMVDIDTGAIWLDSAHVQTLYGLISADDATFDRFVNETVRLNFYGDFVYPMSVHATLENYLAQAAENPACDALLDCRRAIWQAIGDTNLSIVRLAPAEFIHFGTTREWQELLLQGEERFGFLGWRRSVVSIGVPPEVSAINSIIAPGASIGPGCAIEDSQIGPNAVIGEGCVLSHVDFDGVLAANSALHVLPIEEGRAYCARLYGTGDNPKQAAWFSRPLTSTLWDAPVYPVKPSLRAAIDATLSAEATPSMLSLHTSYTAASLDTLLAWQDSLSDLVQARHICDALSTDAPLAAVLPLLSTGTAAVRQQQMLDQHAAGASFPLRHRLYYLLGQAAEDRDRSQAYDDACWQSINDHLLAAAEEAIQALPPPHMVRQRAEVSLPVRVNWGGGWSDTPPYCLEHGGTVLNTSLLLDGKRPIYALAERLDAPVIRIESDDLGITREYTTIESLATGNPHDPHALCKAALVVCGVVPNHGQGPLKPLLDSLGGGIRMRTAVANVPKGSGLGTSSIVSAAMARALSQLLGQPDDDNRIASLSLCMEQLMNTGGGWQDQLGGLLPGIKLISSHPGTPQALTWRSIPMTDETYAAFTRRSALVFTGQRRMARDILREIMGKAVANDPDTMQILSSIQRLAVLMAFELETGDIQQFARLLREHWDLSKRLDAGSSNTCIDHMITVCRDLIDGTMICGAGGGGFMYMLLKDGVSRQALSDRLDSVFQESGVKVWDATFER